MKTDIKPSTALIIGGITLAGIFFIIAVVSPKSLDWLLHPGDERSERIKKEMERQEATGSGDLSNGGVKPEDQPKNDPITPTPTPEETLQPEEGDIREYGGLPRPECISRDQVVKIISASEEAREGRIVGINVSQDGGQIMVAYRKRTFFGIGSGENQIEGILKRGLRNRFPDRLIRSMRVRSDGTRSVRRGDQNVKVEVLEIESLQPGCRWP